MKYICIAATSGILLFISCLPIVNSFETATTVPQGDISLGGSIAPAYFSVSRNNESPLMFCPIGAISLKYGLVKNLNVGTSMLLMPNFVPGVMFNTKYRFLQDKIDAAFYLSGSYYQVRYSYNFNFDPFIHINEAGTIHFFDFKSNLILSREKFNSFSYCLAFGIHHWHIYSQSDQNNEHSGMTSLMVNFGLPLLLDHQKSNSLKIMPEIGYLFYLTGADDRDNYTFKPLVGQIGIYFGK